MTRELTRGLTGIRPRQALAALLVALLAVAPVSAEELRGRVVGIADGDTIRVLDASKGQHVIRLNGIDAPESGQAFGQVSKQHLSSLVFAQDVLIVWSKVDRYGRKVGTVMRGETNANLEQLRAGLAWFYREYERDVAPELRPIYASSEAEARTDRRGLWRDVNPQPPWQFRHPDAERPAIRTLLSPSSKPAASSAATGPVIGNKNSSIYHVPGCQNYNDVAERNRVYFKTEAEAQAAGFRKARNCS